jgi:galactokinase/mevalonate kinase-like predicted kinase
VVASGDVLLDFDATEVVFADKGITGVGALASPEVARNHGVYCPNENGSVRLFLQKPSIAKQEELGAVNSFGQAILDIGILSLAPEATVRILKLCNFGVEHKGKNKLEWKGPLAKSIQAAGLDVYREVCCALGKIGYEDYKEEVRAAGSRVNAQALRSIHQRLRHIPFHVHVVPRLRFLHFGTLLDLIESGAALRSTEVDGFSEKRKSVVVNSRIIGRGTVQGEDVWVEGCRIEAPLVLPGYNVVVGLDITSPLTLPPRGCLDVIGGKGRDGRLGWFVRAYSADDNFHLDLEKGARFCGMPVKNWLESMGASQGDVWGHALPARERTVWNGRFFPFVPDSREYKKWLYLLEPQGIPASQKKLWLEQQRYSLEEIALRADLGSFNARRLEIRTELMRESLASVFGPEGELSARELAFLIQNTQKSERLAWIIALLREAVRISEEVQMSHGLESLQLSRILHTIGSVLLELRTSKVGGGNGSGKAIAKMLRAGLRPAEQKSLRKLGLGIERAEKFGSWAVGMKEAAFRHLGQTIIYRGGRIRTPPKNILRSDEIVWGRAPARLDLGGGWTDTPPYSLERGGCVINAAVNLNGQAPIQAYARVIEKHEIRINSIDHSTRTVVKTLEDLLDYRNPRSQFALAKAALALTGFAPEAANWPTRVGTLDAMLHHFGGGIELTTLAAIPSGSGLGTSSIMGAVLISIISRITGHPLTKRDLFHAVLKLEQELTTGGGWQDQIGGAVEGVKMITSDRGLVPDPRVHFVPADLLDPSVNGGCTLLYYTGLRRLAKNILHEVVGRYLDRDRAAMETLRRLHTFPPLMAEAMGTRDAERFGELIDLAWKLNVDLDPDHTTSVIDELRSRIKPYMSGAKLLGAGGGGFLLMACNSPRDASAVKRMLEKAPPNDKARFFDYSISRTGLVVTVC